MWFQLPLSWWQPGFTLPPQLKSLPWPSSWDPPPVIQQRPSEGVGTQEGSVVTVTVQVIPHGGNVVLSDTVSE